MSSPGRTTPCRASRSGASSASTSAVTAGRTLSFVVVVVGMGSTVLATVSGLAVYDDTLLSVHMILAMVVPLAMALGAPITLALRTLPRRPRSWLLVVLHSRLAKVLTFPPLTFALFVITSWALGACGACRTVGRGRGDRRTSGGARGRHAAGRGLPVAFCP